MYDYQNEKPKIFREENQKDFLRVRDNAARLFAVAGAARFDKLIGGVSGDTFLAIAYVDRLVELGEIIEVSNGVSTQYRVYVKGGSA